jgi:methionine sulfoxide reductase heme-binding subunit
MLASSTVFWYASRATGVVATALLTAVIVLGIAVSRKGRLPGLPRFAGLHLHRYLSLLAVGFVAVHVLTAVADSYVSIRLAAVIIPFTSAYKPIWLGLGTVALDLIAALIVTSALRHRIGRRTWRSVHWLAYLSWPVALAHGLGASQDLRSGPLLALTAVCTAAVLATAGWRLTAAALAVPRARRVPTLMSAPQDLVRAGHR